MDRRRSPKFGRFGSTNRSLILALTKVFIYGNITLMQPKTIGIVGSRKRDTKKDFRRVESAFILLFEPGDMIISGLCSTGGDRFAAMLQDKYDMDYVWFPADWGRFGNGAGKHRNTFIANASDYLIATPVRKPGGTDDTIAKFIRKHGKDNLMLL